jgi:hypothetical protein
MYVFPSNCFCFLSVAILLKYYCFCSYVRQILIRVYRFLAFLIYSPSVYTLSCVVKNKINIPSDLIRSTSKIKTRKENIIFIDYLLFDIPVRTRCFHFLMVFIYLVTYICMIFSFSLSSLRFLFMRVSYKSRVDNNKIAAVR